MTAATAIITAIVSLSLLLGASWSQPAPRRNAVAPRPRQGRAGARDASRDLVEFVERTSRDVRSGMSLRPALLNALDECPRPLLEPLRDQLARGVPLRDALERCASPDTDLGFVVQGLRVAAQTGGAMADTLDRVVAVVRERATWRAERHAQAAQARLSARMLTVLPLAVAAWGLVSGPRVRHAYVQSPVAGAFTAVGVALNLVGWWWMRRLVSGPQAR